MQFLLNSADAELLIHFEQNPSLSSLSNTLGRDPTVISRQLKRISECGDFLTKISGRWKLTNSGKKINQLTRDYILAQNKIVQQKIHLKIGATREFSARILGNHYQDFKKNLNVDSISIISIEGGIEQALLKGEIDIGFDCGRPYSPEVLYKQVLDEPISPVASKKMLVKLKTIKKFNDLEDFPHIYCERLHPEAVKQGKFHLKNISSHTNDIATARSLCISSQGWALLPVYAIKEELQTGRLNVINDIAFRGAKFGVFQLRTRKNLVPYFEKAIKWILSKKSLLDSI